MGALALDHVTVRFDETVALDDVCLTVPAGEVVAVVGPSGCGKSTLLRAVAGLEALAGGAVRFDGCDLAPVPTHRRGFAMMFQDGQLFMHLDVAGNVGYPLRLRGLRGAALEGEVKRLLALVDLPGYAARRPATLSGGEQQRVALARALAARPRLLLLDEPLSALDRALRERLAADLRAVLLQTRTSALLVTHDQDEAFTVADRMAVMRDGQLVQEGSTAQVWRHPVDAETARFLGYDTVLGPAAAGALLSCAGVEPLSGSTAPVALRRTALRVDATGPAEATVTAVAGARDGVHVELVGAGWGPAQGLGPLDLAVAVGDKVRVRLDPAGVASLPP